MRILIFHGYLLEGTGSNVYNARLAAALRAAGHEVHLLCQQRGAERLAFVDATGEWRDGRLTVAVHRQPVRCTVYRPDIGRLLPVYVLDRYAGFETSTFDALSDRELDVYIARNVAATAEVARRAGAELALANHLVMGPAILARALVPASVPYAVKIHGSALEYTVKPHPERFLPYAREGLAHARAVLVGSRYTAESLWQTLGDGRLATKTRLGPPGVDVERFRPLARPEAARALALAERLKHNAGVAHAAAEDDSFGRDPALAAAALRRLHPERERLVAFVGKLIVNKGIDLLAAAFPLVLAREPAARLVVVGFGAFRAGLERLLAALAAGDLDGVRALARAGRALEGGPRAPLTHLLEFLDTLAGAERERYLAAAAGLEPRVVLTGRLEHDELATLLPACEALVVPSTFPEAFGMVAVEAAACATLPISAAHSGLAEVSAALAAAVPAPARELLSFAVDANVVRAIAGRLEAWLGASEQLRERTRTGLRAEAERRWSWAGVAGGVVAAADGELDALPVP